MRYLRYLLILLLAAIAIWRILPQLKDFHELLNMAKNINVAWIAVAILAQATQYIGDGWLSYLLLKIIGININFSKTTLIASLNVFAAHILPVGQAGVIATVYYFYRKLGVDNQSLIFLTAAWSLSTGLSLIIILLVSVVFLPKIPYLHFHLSTITLYFLAASAVIISVFILYRKSLWPKIEKFLKKHSFAQELLTFLGNIEAHKKAILKNKNLVALSLVAGFIYYAGNIITLSACFLAFGHMPPLPLITFAYFISLIAGWVTLAPGGIGATEATMLIIFSEFGIEPSLSLAAMLAFRLISFWIPIPAGAISFAILQRSFKKAKIEK